MEGETIVNMEGETRVNSGLITAHPISVLVVDDDTTCLAIVAAKLKRFQYQVVTVKHPNEALCTLRIKGDAFDLVVTDVHMPEMNGIQLQQVIAREFHLPVVLMSADKKEDVVLEGLENGAAFYISKPVSASDLKDLWQFAVTKKKKSGVVIEETHEIITISNNTSSSDVAGGTAPSTNNTAGSTSSVNEVSPDHNKDLKRKPPQQEESSGKGKKLAATVSQKKHKIFWSNALHDRFLEAVTTIGLDRAVPKKILEVMDVPNLTRENVASHLQKYRIFLRRVTAEANMKLRYYSEQSRSVPPEIRTLARTSDSSFFPNDFTIRDNPTPKSFSGAKNPAIFINLESSSRDILGQSGVGAKKASFFLNQESSSRDILGQSGVGAKNASFFLNQESPSSVILGQSGFGAKNASFYLNQESPSSVILDQSGFGAKNASFFLNQESPSSDSLTRRHNPTPKSLSGAKNAPLLLNLESSSSDILGQSGVGAKNASFFLNQESPSSDNLTRRHSPTPKSFSGAKNASIFVNRESSSSDMLGQPRLGQSRLLSNGGNLLIPNVARTSRTTGNDSSRLMQMYQNITSVQGNPPRTLSAHFDPLVPASTTGGNLVIADYGVPNSCMNNGISSPNFNSLSATTWKDTATHTNYVGLNLSNVQHLLDKSAGKQPACDKSAGKQPACDKSAGKQPACDGRINNLASEPDFQNNANAGTGLGSNESAAIDVDEMDGDLLWDDALAAQSQMLMQSQVYKEMGNVDNGLGEISYDCSSPLFDLDELTNLPLDQDCNFNPENPTPTYPIVNPQNQVQDYDNFSDFGQALNTASADPIMNVQYQVQDNDDALTFDQALNGTSADPIVNFQNQVQNYDNISFFDQALNQASSYPVVNVQNQVQNYDDISFFDQALDQASSDPIVNVQDQVQNYDHASSFDQVLNQCEDDDLLESLLRQYA